MRPVNDLPPTSGIQDDWLRWLPALLLAWLLCVAPQVFAQSAPQPVQPSAAPTIPPAARDAALESTISRSLRLNPLLSSRRSEVSAARHEIDAARWQYAPTVSTQLQAATGQNTMLGSALRADQRIYTGGRIEADVNAALSRRDSAVLSVQESGLGVALQVVGAWQALQSAQGQAQAIAQYRARLDRYDAKITRRIDSGVSPQSEQALVGARLAQSDNDRAAARTAAVTAQATLQRLSGGSAPEPMPEAPVGAARVPGEAPVTAAICIGGDAARESALDRHPALRRMTQDIESARFSLQSQRASSKPSVTLRLEQPIGHQPVGVSRSPRVALLLEMSSDALLAGGSRADSSAERVVALSHQLSAARRELGQQIESECAEQANVAQRVVGFERAGGLTADVLASYERLFVAGKRGWLDVLNAAREDFENRQGANAAQSALQASHYRLALLSGEYALGLPNPQDEAPMTPLLAQIGNRVAEAAKRLVAAPVAPALPPMPRTVTETASVARLPAFGDATITPLTTAVAVPALVAAPVRLAMLPSIEPLASTAPLATIAAIPHVTATQAEPVQLAEAEPSEDPLTQVAAMTAIAMPVPSAPEAAWQPLPAASAAKTRVAVASGIEAPRRVVRVARLHAPKAERTVVAAASADRQVPRVSRVAAASFRLAPATVTLARVVVSHRALRRVTLLPAVSCIPRRDCDPRDPLRARSADAAAVAVPAHAAWQVAHVAAAGVRP